MSRACRAVGCTEEISPRLWGCRKHWRMVPKPLQRAVSAAALAYGASGHPADGRALLLVLMVAKTAVAVYEGKATRAEAEEYIRAGCGYVWAGASEAARDLWSMAGGAS